MIKIGLSLFTIWILAGCGTNVSPSNGGTGDQTFAPNPTKTTIPVETKTVKSPIETRGLPPTPTYTYSYPVQTDLNTLAPGLYIVSRSDENGHTIRTLAGEKVSTLFDFYNSANIDPSNTLVAYDAGTLPYRSKFFGHDFALLNLNTTEFLPIDMMGRYGYGASWSPDGSMLVLNWIDIQLNYVSHLGVVETSTGIYSDIPLWDGEAASPAWSPDGKWIAFDTIYFRGGMASDIWLLDTQCLSDLESCVDNVQKIFSNENMSFQNPSWSPDSTQLIFSGTEISKPNCELYIGDISTGTIQNITNTPECERFPNWSPDGQWIAYSDRFNLYIMKPDGSGKRLIMRDEDFGFWLTISD